MADRNAAALMQYDARKKSAGVAYLLWLFLSGFGVHNFYLGRTGAGVAQLLLCLIGWATSFLLIGIPMLLAWAVWIIVDAFRIPGWVEKHNIALATSIGAGPAAD